MRFDVARALETAEGFAFDRQPWTEGGRRATDRVAAAFEGAGCTVERAEVVGSPAARNRRLALTWLGFGAGLSVNLVALAAAQPTRISLGALAFGFVWCLLARAFPMRPTRLSGRFLRTWNVVGSRPGDADAPARVVFVTSLDASPPVPRTATRSVAAKVLAAVVLVVVLLNVLPTRLSKPAYLAVLLTFQIALITYLVARIRPFPGEGGMDNRDGLGLLVELARAWPPTERRVEARFVAAGGQLLDAAGMRGLKHQIDEEWPKKPTLVVGIWSPGRSRTLALVSPGSSSVAVEAANGLWIPARVLNAASVLNDAGAMGDGEFVGLIGVPDEESVPPIDGEALRRAAQLAAEIALRWARQTASQEPGASPVRSSQNPG